MLPVVQEPHLETVGIYKALYIALLYCTSQVLHFLQTKGGPSTSRKVTTGFVVILASLGWTGTEPAISRRWACTVLSNLFTGYMTTAQDTTLYLTFTFYYFHTELLLRILVTNVTTKLIFF